jgi:choline dehydrogenase
MLHEVETVYRAVGYKAGLGLTGRDLGRIAALRGEYGEAHRLSPDSSMWIEIPAGVSRVLNNTRLSWNFDMDAGDALGSRRVPMYRGRVLGGCSSVNGLLYVRGQPRDYDEWSELGNRGWSYAEVLSYFKKSEHYDGTGDGSRGRGGPLYVRDTIECDQLCDAVLEAAEASGYPRNADYNNGHQEGFGYFQVMVRNGRRWSAARAYLDPARGRPNLRIETEALVSRVVFEGKRAIGVQYVRNGEQCIADCRREVIVSCGAVQSPCILELSGIGQPEILQRHGIKARLELRGVGENYANHAAVALTWRVKGAVTLNERARGLRLLLEIARYYGSGRGVLTWPPGQVCGFLRTSPELERPDIQFLMVPATANPVPGRGLEREPGMTLLVSQCRPESRGSIHIKSAEPGSQPGIRSNLLSSSADRECMLAGMKIAREIMRHPAIAKYIAFESSPDAKVQTDGELMDFLRTTGRAMYHPIGTCKMGSDSLGVVDERLRVRGTERLRVIDASVMPTMPSGNVYAPTIMIAEKGADMVKQDAMNL